MDAETLRLIQDVGPVALIALVMALSMLTTSRKDRQLADAEAASRKTLNEIALNQMARANDAEDALTAERRRIAEFEVAMQKAHVEIEHLKELVESVSRQRDDAERRLVLKQREFEGFRLSVDEAVKRVNGYDTQMQEMQAALAALQRDMDNMTSANDMLRTTNQALARKIEVLESENSALKQQRDQLHRDLDQLQQQLTNAFQMHQLYQQAQMRERGRNEGEVVASVGVGAGPVDGGVVDDGGGGGAGG